MDFAAQFTVVLTADCTETYGLCTIVSIFRTAALNSCWSILTTFWGLFCLPSGSSSSLTLYFPVAVDEEVLCKSVSAPSFGATDSFLQTGHWKSPSFSEFLMWSARHRKQSVCRQDSVLGSVKAPRQISEFHQLSQDLPHVRQDFLVTICHLCVGSGA